MRHLLLATLLIFPIFAHAATMGANIYEIKNVSVLRQGADAATGRDKALEDAQKKAFDVLQDKLLADKHIQKKLTLTPTRIAAAVKSVDVVSEKITAKEYRASYNISFSPQEISRIFGIDPIAAPASDASTAASADKSTSTTPKDDGKYLVVPIVVEEGVFKIWKNDWEKSWIDLKRDNLLMPLGDLQDVQSIKQEDLETNKYEGVFRMAKRYSVNNMVIIQAKYMPEKNSLMVKLEKIKGRERTVINYEYPGQSGITRADLFYAATNDLSYRLLNDKLTDNSLITSGEAPEVNPKAATPSAGAAPAKPAASDAANSPLNSPRLAPPYSPNAPGAGILGERRLSDAGGSYPKAEALGPRSLPPQAEVPLKPRAFDEPEKGDAPPVPKNRINAVVTAPDLIAWTRIKNTIITTPGITNLQINSLSPGQASISLTHSGDIEATRTALAERGLLLIGNDQGWEIREKQ